MKKFNSYILTSLVSICFMTTFPGCKKTKETIEAPPSINELLPVFVGKETYYRLDSTIIALNGNNQSPEVKRYLLKEVVSSVEKDNLNQPYWKIDKFLNNDLEGKGTWYPGGFYFITYLKDKIEVTENNLRFIKLVQPLREGYSWKGNSYLPDEPLKEYFLNIFEFNNIEQNMKNWIYNYKTIGAAEILPSQISLQDVTTVEQININNVPDGFIFGSSIPFGGYASQELSVEKYAKGKGLIYQEQDLWEYQSNRNETKGFRIKKWLINQ